MFHQKRFEPVSNLCFSGNGPKLSPFLCFNPYFMKGRNFIFILGAGLMLTAFVLPSCNKDNNGSVENISSSGGNKSHNMGQNCMNCHKKGGEGEGWFTVAGTTYDGSGLNTKPNLTIKLYTAENSGGTLAATVYGDARGNFYTTKKVDFGSGLYPVVEGGSSTLSMSQSITTGACNSCHGLSTAKISVD